MGPRIASMLAVTVVLGACEGEPQRLDAAARLVHGDFPEPAASAEEAARRFLGRRSTPFQLDGVDLVLEQTRRGRAGTYLRFGQRASGMVVFDGQVIVLVDAGLHVRAANLAHRRVAAPPPARVVGESEAARAALAALGVDTADVTSTLGIERDGTAAYRVRVAEPGGAWEIVVDAAGGAVRAVRDLRWYADGMGLVFDPNPVASTGNFSFRDNNDATTPALDAARFARVLPRLDGSGFLRGQWVDSRPKTVNRRAVSASLTFNYDRSDPDGHFEETMAYFHIDRAQARIQALGFTDVNNRVQIANVNDFNRDNSFYNPIDKELSFGIGGVDDAEDADVILHEYGHSIQDNQVPGFGGGDEGAMGEGFGDYFAASFNATLSPQVTDPLCLAEWDSTSYSTSIPPCLRRVDSTKHYPEMATGEVHDDGEMWSAALYRARGLVGVDAMDTLVLESHFLLSTGQTFEAATAAILATDDTLFGGAHRTTLRRTFVWQGLSRALSPPSSFTQVLFSEPVTIENSRTGGQYANHLDEVRTHTSPGAAALRVHFVRIDTELAASCLQGACDNIYLYDRNGDLYQILNGAQMDVTSLAIPGDQVQIRLVTDATVTGFGYQIDRVDILGPPPAPDAGTPPPPPDAGPPDAPPPDAPPPPDALSPPPDARAPVADARVADASGGPDARPAGEAAGCSCRAAASGGTGSAWLAGVVALALLRRRRSINSRSGNR
ncbi:MAG TPA: M36 family metallopeptidase [Haliangiales bacterium]|nr:M36 family metallopeptidase [Haliangiales bacterium]